MVLALRTVDLVKIYPARHGPPVGALQGVSVELEEGKTLGIVGESGCGKSTLARTILQLVPATEGTIVLEGRNLTVANSAEVTAARRTLQMAMRARPENPASA